jgi:heme exporter protein C
MWTFFHKLASPPHFYDISAKFIPWFAALGLALIGYGTVAGLFFAYSILAASAAIGLIWRMKLAHAVAAGAAPLGAWFTFLALATGSIWGRPMWGTWWEWGDPRLTSELIMLFLYFGYMALRAAIDDTTKADKASAVLALVGAVNVPIIHFSVEWWSSLHQGPTLVREGGPAIEPAMLYPLLAMIFGFTFFFGALLLARVRTEVLSREHRARWVRNMVMGESA